MELDAGWFDFAATGQYSHARSESTRTDMADTPDPKYMDKRTAERYQRAGLLDEKAYERHLKSLPDVAEKSVSVETTMTDDEDFDDDEEEDEGGDEDGASA